MTKIQNNIMIQLETVPEYLRKGELYNIFLENDDDSLIPISKQYYKEDTSIDTIDDLYHLFHTLRYWMIEENDYPYKNIFDFVRNNKDLDYNSFYEIFIDVQFIKQIKILIKSDNLCNSSCDNGYLLLLKYAHEKGCPWDEMTCSYAALNGCLDCLQYAHENGCPWDRWTCILAAEKGKLECLKYAHVNGCPWHRWTCENAALFTAGLSRCSCK